MAAFWLAVAAAAPAAAATMPPQSDAPRPVPELVAHVLRDADGDLVPDRVGETATVAGFATTFVYQARDDIEYFVMADDSGGIRILTPDESLLEGIVPGTGVQVTGVLTHRRGVAELFVDDIITGPRERPPVPRDVLVVDLLSERYSQQLVRVAGELSFEATDRQESPQALLTDRTGSIPVRINSRLRADDALWSGLLDAGEVVIVGIAGQSDREAPFDSGYRLAPREPFDFTFIRPFPYAAVGFGALIVLFAGVTATLLLRRRSAERRAEELAERNQLERQLLQAQKMEALGRMAGGIAHDLNNMLTTVMGTADMLLTRTAEPRLTEGLTWIREASERSADLSKRLLELSRQRVTRPQVVDLNEELRDLLPILHGMLRADVEFVADLGTQPIWIEIDPAQLRQVFLNLALNANEAMNRGGRLHLVTERVDGVGGDGGAGGEAVVRVSDTGPGIDAETLEHVFEPFFSTKKTGSGLGLAIVHGIVQRAGGRVEVDSEPGRGTTFEIRLPEPAGRPRNAHEPAPARALNGSGTILLAEDDADVRGLAGQVLDQAGYTVVQAADGEQARRVFEAAPDDFDLLLSDVVMPGLGGAELAEIVAGSRPDLPVVFMSGYVDTDDAHEVIAKHDAEFLQKPWQVDDLLATVGAAIAARR